MKIIRCDNAGENTSFKDQVDWDPDLNLEFEFIAPGTPQQNGKIERKFATLFGRARSMLNQAKLSRSKRNELWAEAANTATMLDNITVSSNEESSYQKFYMKDPKWMRNLKCFGEIGIVTDHERKKIR